MPINKKTKNPNTMLNGYFGLFLAFQALNLILASVGFIRNVRIYFALIASGYMAAYVCLYIADILLNALVIAFFMKKKKGFIKIYCVSALSKIILAILELTVFSSLLATGGFYNVTMSILGIILNIVMLYFWLTFFKNSVMLKAYLKAGTAPNKKSRKYMAARRKFKVIK